MNLEDLSFPVIFKNTQKDLHIKIYLNKFSDNKHFYEENLSQLIVDWMNISLYDGFGLGVIPKEPGVINMGSMIFEVKKDKSINFYVNLRNASIEALNILFIVLDNAINKPTKYDLNKESNDFYSKVYPFRIIKIELLNVT